MLHVVINNKVNYSTGEFRYLPWDFPARGLISCLFACTMLYFNYVISAAVYGNQL